MRLWAARPQRSQINVAVSQRNSLLYQVGTRRPEGAQEEAGHLRGAAPSLEPPTQPLAA
jgi:hypothetical protein